MLNRDESTPAHIKRCIAPAWALVPQLTQIVQNFPVKAADMALAEALIEERVILPASDESQIYLGCLLKAYMHLLSFERPPENTIEARLREFILGHYYIDTRPVLYEDFEASHDNRPSKVGVYFANRFAMTHICQKELEKAYGNELGSMLARSTVRLFDASVRDDYTLAGDLLAHDCNPFAQARIVEFAGNDFALDRTMYHDCFTLLHLLGEYTNYSPSSESAVIAPASNAYINVEKPGQFFPDTKAHHEDADRAWPESRKYDYAIAANIFCIGSIQDARGKVELFARDLLPHFANILKDGGELVIASLLGDGLNMARSDRLATYGFHDTRASGERSYGSRLYWLTRDYALRPPIAYTHEERLRDLRPNEALSALSYVQREHARKESALSDALEREWANGF